MCIDRECLLQTGYNELGPARRVTHPYGYGDFENNRQVILGLPRNKKVCVLS